MDNFRLIETLRRDDENSSKISEKSKEMNSVLSKYPLRFIFNYGGIGRIHPADEEEIWALNMKRGILSLIQNTMILIPRNKSLTVTEVKKDNKTSQERTTE